MARVWIFQDPKQLLKHGPAQTAWSVGWYAPDGKRRSKTCGTGSEGKRNARKLAEKTTAELVTGTYEDRGRKTWAEFRGEYEDKALAVMDVHHRELIVQALDQFERLAKPVRMQGITGRKIAEFVAKRRGERGRVPGSKVSVATINKQLRRLRVVLRRADKWGYLAAPVEIDFLKEPLKLPTYATPEDFARLYLACDYARAPVKLPYSVADWWRGLLVAAFMSGWRIGSLLALRRQDVDLETGIATSQAADNKGKRDQKVILHPLILSHLRKLASFSPVFFPWSYGRRRLYKELERMQAAAGIKPAGGKAYFTFHDLRRSFATLNADRMTPEALQALMQHRDFATTLRYIATARQLSPAVQNLFVPDLTVPAKRALEG